MRTMAQSLSMVGDGETGAEAGEGEAAAGDPAGSAWGYYDPAPAAYADAAAPAPTLRGLWPVGVVARLAARLVALAVAQV